MSESEARRFIPLLHTDKNWMKWHEGKFVAVCEEGVLGVDEDLNRLQNESLVRYHQKRGSVLFAKVEGGRIIEVPKEPVPGIQ